MATTAVRLQRLDDSTSSLLESYAKLLKSAQDGATVGELQSSVLIAGLVPPPPPEPQLACAGSRARPAVRRCMRPTPCWPSAAS